jgi:hypothetical protein
MPTYRPRCAASLLVPVMGAPHEKLAQAKDEDLVHVPLRVRRAWWELNDHAHADVLKLTTEWRDAGTDPRMLSSAVVHFYLGSADENGDWQPSPENLRFVGIFQKGQRSAKDGEGFTVELEFHDYTSLFLKCKLPQDGIPDYSQSLDEAWRRICAHTGFMSPDAQGKIVSVVEQLRDRLVPIGSLRDTWPPVLDKAASSRFARLAAKVPVKPEADAWAVWQQCVGMCGLISFMRRDECIVTLAQDYYTEQDPPRLVWGHNILSLVETRSADIAGKGVALTSFDPITLTTIESFYPPQGDTRATHKHAVANDKGLPASRYDFFPYTGVTDQKRLDELCRRVWEERSRQELEGTVVTAEMFTETMSKESFDLLTLGSGDVIRVEFEERDREPLSRLRSIDERVAYLVERQYSPEVATLMAKNFDGFATLKPEFCVRRVTVDLQAGGKDEGSFEVQINFVNRIAVTGDAGWI